MRSLLLAPLSIVGFYLVMATLAFLSAPSMEATWVYWVVGYVAVVAYVVLVPAGMLLHALYRAVGGPPLWACFAVGIVVAIGTAVVFDLPEPNFQRFRYYGFAGFAGVLWALTFDRLSKPEGRDE
jgi:hypothetical protein